MNIYVGNLPFNISEDEVRQAFAPFGDVSSISLIKDQFTGRPRGFAFVEMQDSGEANAAIAALNGKDLMGRALVVNEAQPRAERPRTGGGDSGRFNRDGGGAGARRGFGGERRPGGGGRGGRDGKRGGGRSGSGGGFRREW